MDLFMSSLPTVCVSEFLIPFIIISAEQGNICKRKKANVSSSLVDHVGRSRVHGIGVLVGSVLIVSRIIDGLLVLYLLRLLKLLLWLLLLLLLLQVLLLSFLLHLIFQWLFIGGVRWIELVREDADKHWNDDDG